MSVERLNDINNLLEGGSMENNHEMKHTLKVSKQNGNQRYWQTVSQVSEKC